LISPIYGDVSLFVAGEITSNRPPVQHYGNHTFRKGDLPAALDRASMAHARTHPPPIVRRPARNADRDQRIAIELINLPFLRAGGSADEYRAGIERAIAKGWRRHFEEPIPLPDEMAAKAAAGLLSRFPVAARSAGTRA